MHFVLSTDNPTVIQCKIASIGMKMWDFYDFTVKQDYVGRKRQSLTQAFVKATEVVFSLVKNKKIYLLSTYEFAESREVDNFLVTTI